MLRQIIIINRKIPIIFFRTGGGGGRDRDILGDAFLVDLENMDGHAGGGGELLVAGVALEVLSLLVLNQYLLVIELPVAVVAPNLR